MAAAKPLMKGSIMKKGSRRRAGVRKSPARTPRLAANPQERPSIHRVGIPKVWAAAKFSEVARMAMPSLVFCTSEFKSPQPNKPITKVPILSSLITTPPNSQTFVSERGKANVLVSVPQM
jgi:hypothetical protein